MRLATQTLLADRFGLRAHRETRELDIYALTMARSGGQPGRALKAVTETARCMPRVREPPGP
jgi:uncharacterized protein (TIGR03435 family)